MPRYKNYRSSYLRRREKPVSKRRRTLRQKLSFAWKVTKLLALLSIVALIAIFYHFRSIDKEIAEKFDRPRKWDLPSRVYSDAEYLYPGINTKEHDIIAKLDRLGYRNVNSDIKGAGEFFRKGNSLQIYLHDFEYPGESFKGFPIDIRTGGDKIISISNMSSGETLPLIRLEPEEVASIFNEKMEDRTVVTLQEVPENLIEAVILIEDERFFKHSGVDPFGIVRAALVNLKSMRIAQGGSTLTQQLVKNFFLHSKKSFIRKFNEMLIATRIEKKHSKAEILEAYLNEIYLGQRGYSSVSGVAEASKLYFGKNVGQLSTGECALLAGMIRLPSRYNPITNPE
ncbi:MAG TPA: transglycosylase domain-containing protein, partial [bacterium]|nr:transglycosylase domain-containing protein [bacterium]